MTCGFFRLFVLVAVQDDVYREAVTDGYLIDHAFAESLTTESPKSNTTVPASQPPSSESKDGGLVEGSGENNYNFMFPRDEGDSNSESSTTESPESGFTSSTQPNEAMTKDSGLMEASGDTSDIFMTSTFPQYGGDSSSESPTIESPQSGLTSSSEPNEATPTESYVFEGSAVGVEFSTSTVSPQSEDQSSVTPDNISVAQTTDPAVSTTDLLGSDSGSGSGLDSNNISLKNTAMHVEGEGSIQSKLLYNGKFPIPALMIITLSIKCIVIFWQDLPSLNHPASKKEHQVSLEKKNAYNTSHVCITELWQFILLTSTPSCLQAGSSSLALLSGLQHW